MDDIRGLKPYVFFSPNWKLIVACAIAVLLVAWAIAWWLNRPAKPKLESDVFIAPTAPARSVRAQLDALKASRLIEQQRVRDFHGRLSAIVRTFVGQLYDLPGSRLTTTELLAALEAKGVDQAVQTMLANFLPQCDLAKFADEQPTRAEMELRLQTAYHLVEQLGDAATPDEDDAEEVRDVVG
ncbi:MAG TPA: hypothetical protein V6D47_13725 [Oscillatoriaceae cyanobacterium]